MSAYVIHRHHGLHQGEDYPVGPSDSGIGFNLATIGQGRRLGSSRCAARSVSIADNENRRGRRSYVSQLRVRRLGARIRQLTFSWGRGRAVSFPATDRGDQRPRPFQWLLQQHGRAEVFAKPGYDRWQPATTSTATTSPASADVILHRYSPRPTSTCPGASPFIAAVNTTRGACRSGPPGRDVVGVGAGLALACAAPPVRRPRRA